MHDLARPAGRSSVTLPRPGAGRLQEPFYRKELTLRATRLYAEDFAEAVPLVAEGHIAVDRLVTHRFPLSEAALALSLPGEHPDEAVKVVVIP
jgi:threonine dehydrogenase-like Zn-dependent dehydrogenase